MSIISITIFQNALDFALCKGLKPCLLSPKCANAMRDYVSNQIVTHAKKPKAQRTKCDAINCKRQLSTWIQCGVCGRWLHFKRINITKAPESDYVCVVCNAQYE